MIDRRILDRFGKRYEVLLATPGVEWFIADLLLEGAVENDPEAIDDNDAHKALCQMLTKGWTEGWLTTLTCYDREGNNKCVGVVCISRFAKFPWEKQDKMYVWGLYVLPEYRKPGPAVVLMAACRDTIIAAGFDRLEYSANLKSDKHRMYDVLSGEPISVTYRAYK